MGLGGWYWRSQAKNKEEIETVLPKMQDIRESIEFSGRVDALERASLRFAAGGRVVYVGAKEGDQVKKGQTLATIDARSAQKAMEKTLSLYQTERWDYENSQDTRDNRWLNDREQRLADQDQYSLNRSVADVELQALVVESTRIWAPFAGVLVRSPLAVAGSVVLATDIWEVVNPDSLYFRLLVDEVDVDEVRLGLPVEVRLDADTSRVLKGTVRKIGLNALDTSSGTFFPVEIEFSDAVDAEFVRLGMNGEAEIIIDETSNVLTVPSEAVSLGGEQPQVQVLVDGKPADRTVEIGLRNDDDIQILSGLGADEVVVLP